MYHQKHSSMRLGRRMDLQLTFFFPLDKQTGLGQLYCSLVLNGRTTDPYGSGVHLLSHLWQQQDQLATGQSAEIQIVNQTLSDIRAEHRILVRNMIRAGLEPTADTLRRQWLCGEPVMPTLLQTYDDYLRYLDQLPLPERKSESSTFKWHKAYRYLQEYLQYTNQPNLMLTEVTQAWGRNYVFWLRKIPLSLDTAARYFGYVRAALQYAVEQQLVSVNALWGMEIKREAAKPVQCLSQEQIMTLATCVLPDRLHTYRQWALLCCYTGLDYYDAVKVAHNQKDCTVSTLYGDKIVWRRQKIAGLMQMEPHHGVCHIPILPEAKELLAQAVDWPIPSIQRVNANLRLIERIMKLPFRFTTKTCRKTAGTLFVLRGARMDVVQQILGHKNFTTLQRNYIQLMGQSVDEYMRSVNT